MRNRAKCKLCNEIIESFHSTDYVQCKCGEIIVDGGLSYKCAANNWKNFLRIDDEGNEIIVQIEELTKNDDVNPLYNSKPTRDELIKQLHAMMEGIEKLPQHAMNVPITHYDLFSLVALLLAIFRSDCKDEI